MKRRLIEANKHLLTVESASKPDELAFFGELLMRGLILFSVTAPKAEDWVACWRRLVQEKKLFVNLYHEKSEGNKKRYSAKVCTLQLHLFWPLSQSLSSGLRKSPGYSVVVQLVICGWYTTTINTTCSQRGPSRRHGGQTRQRRAEMWRRLREWIRTITRIIIHIHHLIQTPFLIIFVVIKCVFVNILSVGCCDESPFAFASFSAAVACMLNDIDSGCNFARVALELSKSQPKLNGMLPRVVSKK